MSRRDPRREPPLRADVGPGASRIGLTTFVLVFGTTEGVARAADALHFRWTAPDGCPNEADVRAASLRGVDAESADETLEVEALVETIDAAEKPWRVKLSTRRGESRGEREIVAGTCDGVAEATAVLVALAMSSRDVAFELPIEEASRPSGESRPPDDSRPSDAKRAARSPSRSRARAFAFGASLAADSSALPRFAVGGSLTAAWTPGRARLELDGRVWSSQSASMATSSTGARFSMRTLGGRACWSAVRSGALEVSPCAGADVNFVTGAGYGTTRDVEGDAAWTVIAAGGLVRLRLTPWLALRSRIEAAVPVTRPTFVVENVGDLHQPSAWTGLVSVGLEVNFP